MIIDNSLKNFSKLSTTERASLFAKRNAEAKKSLKRRLKKIYSYIKNKAGENWTKEEDSNLRMMYSSSSDEEILRALPNKSPENIFCRAFLLNLVRSCKFKKDGIFKINSRDRKKEDIYQED